MEDKEGCFSPEKIVGILRELLEKQIPLSDLTELYSLSEETIIRWKEKLFQEAPSIFAGKSAEISLEPYITWTPIELKDPRESSPGAIQENLLAIIEAEGPMFAIRAYQIYVKAAGLSKVGGGIRAIFNGALQQLVLDGKVLIRNETEDKDYHNRIARTPEMEEVVLRQIGPRELEEIPPSELSTAIGTLLAKNPGMEKEELFRNVLDLYGITRLTRKAQDILTSGLVFYKERLNSDDGM